MCDEVSLGLAMSDGGIITSLISEAKPLLYCSLKIVLAFEANAVGSHSPLKHQDPSSQLAIV